jgi:hypothetical protein
MLVHLQDDVGERPILDRVGKMIKEICTSDDPSQAVTILENVITDIQCAAWNYSIDRGLPPRAAFYLHSSSGGANHGSHFEGSEFTALAGDGENLDILLTEPTGVGSGECWEDTDSLINDNEDFLKRSTNYGQAFLPSTINLTSFLPSETQIQPSDELNQRSRRYSASIESPKHRSSIAAATVSDMSICPANSQCTLNGAKDVAFHQPIVVLPSTQSVNLSLQQRPRGSHNVGSTSELYRNAVDKSIGNGSLRSGNKDNMGKESNHNEKRDQPGQYEKNILQRVETSAGQDEALEDSNVRIAVQSDASKLPQVHADPDRVNNTAECSSRNAAVDNNNGGSNNINHNNEVTLTRQINGDGQSANGHETIKLTPNKLARRKGKGKPYSDRSFRPEKASRLFSLSGQKTRAQQKALSIPIDEWTELAQIPNKVIDPDEVYSTLAMSTRIEHQHYLPFLTRLFFHSWGPYAFEQIRQTCSVLRLITNRSPRVKASPSDLMKALDEIDGFVVRRRSYLVQLLHQRQERESSHRKAKSTHQTRSGRRIKRSKSDGTKPRKKYERADSQAISDLMTYQYPELAREDRKYDEHLSKLRYRLGAARNWDSACKRKASAYWMYPCGMVDLSSETLADLPGVIGQG